MPDAVRLLIGTKKGLFFLDSDAGRTGWRLTGPHCATWPINHAVADPATGAIHAGGGNEWFGPAVWTSRDGGASWTHSSAGIAYEEGAEPVKSVWSLMSRDGRLYAGVQPAGLFVSTDGGENFAPLDALRHHPSRERWMPGAAGLILHHIVGHPRDAARLWVAISAAGVFATEDGGQTWTPRNHGTRQDYAPEEHRYAEVGQCVHSLTMAAGQPDRLYQQNHCGMYRSDDAGANWQSIEPGLPSTFGFPAVAHPSDPDTLFLFPLNGDQQGRFAPDAQAAVWRTRDGGATWAALRTGLPQQGAYLTVLRQAMATDAGDPAGVYFGTTSGEVYASADEGESWQCVARHLPMISSVEAMRR
ncbi:MAG: exo-alpha-sialidase [Thermohalobaculum sp.]|nr:exo-alpha-sialidase [Thermohalobaculum sp.]